MIGAVLRCFRESKARLMAYAAFEYLMRKSVWGGLAAPIDTSLSCFRE
jgi:hypothetical protein